ncbi:MAG TPA: hypothetical protein VMV82_00580 [Candidatus Dormibacteraeota bacterium]|nr:hypothetical protein [Candidatus Dormibacteraeota bacterium]
MRLFLAICLAVAFARAMAAAAIPGIAELDADARAAGNLKPLAIRIGDRLFATPWPAQVTQVSANGVDGHVVIGVRLSGTHFHRAMSRSDFADEVGRVVAEAFATAPGAEEVDIWASVPIVVGRDVIVSGDLAIPTTKPVFTLSVRRGTDPSRDRAYWDEDWARAAFKQDW